MLFQLEKITLVQVAIPLPVEDPFTYGIPEEWLEKVKPGVRVLVPFKNREIVGFVVDVIYESSQKKIKKIIRVLDEEPILTKHFLELTCWMKDYYFSSWGEAIQTVVPKFYPKRHASIKKSSENSLDIPHQNNATLQSSITLNPEQQTAVDKITQLLGANHFQSALLFGVTGSGKSEVYIRAIKETIKMGKSAICLVPEIALTEQMKRFFGTHFGSKLEIVHSKLSEGERWQAWDRTRKGERSVVLGARSGIFAPFHRLGLVIIDEEQEPSYKQDQTPRYHAREVARWRCQDQNAVLLIGTATPSIESMHQANQGELVQIELTQRIAAKKLPEIEIVDLNQEQQIVKERSIISRKLSISIAQALERKEGILLLLNRRGFSTQTHCLTCARPITCRYCDVSLTYHQESRKLLCHYCNYQVDDPEKCPRCGNSLLKFSGIGTEKVESEVARMFPTARVARLDSDSTQRKGSHEDVLARFRARSIDILVGTQMIAKGFDFPHVTLVGVILADTALALPDFRSSEKTFQLLTQVAGRSGRGDLGGKVVIQTYAPFHYSIQCAKDHATRKFFEDEIVHRRDFQYPPYVKLINIILRGKSESSVIRDANVLRQTLELNIHEKPIDILGPSPLPFGKLRGNYRWHVMLKEKGDENKAHGLLRAAFKTFKKSSGIHVAIDVDPISIL
ncbi:MAG: primosomal protein N' [Candidatus Omnitrophica bacterium]|nr:primosomal protein N' [Candidatus Omnitrophota bacterium]